ncbi:hypothetical protein PCE1_001184 [Barthelona sp. PCE]
MYSKGQGSRKVANPFKSGKKEASPSITVGIADIGPESSQSATPQSGGMLMGPDHPTFQYRPFKRGYSNRPNRLPECNVPQAHFDPYVPDPTSGQLVNPIPDILSPDDPDVGNSDLFVPPGMNPENMKPKSNPSKINDDIRNMLRPKKSRRRFFG